MINLHDGLNLREPVYMSIKSYGDRMSLNTVIEYIMHIGVERIPVTVWKSYINPIEIIQHDTARDARDYNDLVNRDMESIIYRICERLALEYTDSTKDMLKAYIQTLHINSYKRSMLPVNNWLVIPSEDIKKTKPLDKDLQEAFKK